MFRTRIGMVALAACLLIALAAFPASNLGIGQLQGDAQEPAKPQGRDAKLHELLQERLAAAQAWSKAAAQKRKAGISAPEELLEPARLAHEAALDLCTSDKERVAVLERFLAAAKENERIATDYYKSGQGQQTVALKATVERLRVAIALERAKAKSAPQPKEPGPAPQGRFDATRDLQDAAALADRQVQVKRAAIRVAEAQIAIAEARLVVLAAKVKAAEASEGLARARLKRMKDLFATKAVEVGLVEEAERNVYAAAALRQEVEGQFAVGKAEVACEIARREVAAAEFSEAELRAQQIRERSKSKTP